MDAAEIRRLEGIADRAWPAREIARGDDWEARFADGMHRRINSATVWGSGDLDATVPELEAWYWDRGQSPIFKLTDASAPGLDEYLANRGYLRDVRVSIMTAEVTAGERNPPSVRITATPTKPWIDAFSDISGYGTRRRRLLRDTLSRIDATAGYATRRRDGLIVAVGLALVTGDHAGLFEMATHPDHRDRGFATEVLASLLAWMGRQGAATAYLQVLEGNRPARRLYRRAGFTPRYRYWYRAHPGGVPTASR